MHTFLRAIGFSKIKDRKSLDALLGEVMAHPDIKKKHRISMDEDFVEMSNKCAKIMLVKVFKKDM